MSTKNKRKESDEGLKSPNYEDYTNSPFVTRKKYNALVTRYNERIDDIDQIQRDPNLYKK